MNNDINHYYDTVSLIDSSKTIELFFALLASKKKQNNEFVAIFSFDVIDDFSNVLLSEDISIVECSKIIDLRGYYQNLPAWKYEYSKKIEKYMQEVCKNGQNVKMDLLNKKIMINFTIDQITDVLKLYDLDIIEKMNYFVDKFIEIENKKIYSVSNKNRLR